MTTVNEFCRRYQQRGYGPAWFRALRGPDGKNLYVAMAAPKYRGLALRFAAMVDHPETFFPGELPAEEPRAWLKRVGILASKQGLSPDSVYSVGIEVPSVDLSELAGELLGDVIAVYEG